jgi:streptogrisin C
MRNHYGQGEDSGGPWFYGNTAYGLHQGWKWWKFQERDMFTPVTYIDNALGIYVATT